MKRINTNLLGVGLIMAMMAAVVPAVVADARRSRALYAASGTVPPTAARKAAAAFVGPMLPGESPGLLARVAVQKGFMELATEPDLWNRVQVGDPPPGFRLDSVYRDPELGGDYAVGLSSGPLFGQVTITGVARAGRGVRAFTAVYDYFPSASLREADCRWDSASPRCP